MEEHDTHVECSYEEHDDESRYYVECSCGWESGVYWTVATDAGDEARAHRNGIRKVAAKVEANG